jgi:hypothetical protein
MLDILLTKTSIVIHITPKCSLCLVISIRREKSGRQSRIPLISALKRLVTSRPILLGVSSAQMRGVGVSASDSQSHLHGHHSVAEMSATAASATVLNVVRVISTEAGLSVQIAEMKVQRCVSPTSFLPMSRQPFPVPIMFSVSIDQLDKADRCTAHPRSVQISP